MEASFSHTGFAGSFRFAIEEKCDAYLVSLYADARDDSKVRGVGTLFSKKLIGSVKFKSWKDVAIDLGDLLQTPKIWRSPSRAHEWRDGGGAEIGSLWEILKEYYEGVPDGQSRWDERRF